MMHAKVWIEAMKQSETLSHAGLQKVLENFRMTTGGVTTPITYGKDKRKGAGGLKLLRADVKTKQFTPITDWLTPPA